MNYKITGFAVIAIVLLPLIVAKCLRKDPAAVAR